MPPFMMAFILVIRLKPLMLRLQSERNIKGFIQQRGKIVKI